jgi:hypothetical protein
MPKAYLKPRERRLRQLAFGETGTIRFVAVAVDLRGKAWVDYDAELLDEDKNDHITVDVRLEKGGCVLILPPPGGKIPTRFSEHPLDSLNTPYLPVIELITETAMPDR